MGHDGLLLVCGQPEKTLSSATRLVRVAPQELARLLDQLLLLSLPILYRRLFRNFSLCRGNVNRLKLHATVVGRFAQFHRDGS